LSALSSLDESGKPKSKKGASVAGQSGDPVLAGTLTAGAVADLAR